MERPKGEGFGKKVSLKKQFKGRVYKATVTGAAVNLGWTAGAGLKQFRCARRKKGGI